MRELGARTKGKSAMVESLKALRSKGLREISFQNCDLISSQPRYDRFDTSPHLSFTAFLRKSERTAGENTVFNSSPGVHQSLVPQGFPVHRVPYVLRDFESRLL